MKGAEVKRTGIHGCLCSFKYGQRRIKPKIRRVAEVELKSRAEGGRGRQKGRCTVELGLRESERGDQGRGSTGRERERQL